jgi:hypothetical protein
MVGAWGGIAEDMFVELERVGVEESMSAMLLDVGKERRRRLELLLDFICFLRLPDRSGEELGLFSSRSILAPRAESSYPAICEK